MRRCRSAMSCNHTTYTRAANSRGGTAAALMDCQESSIARRIASSRSMDGQITRALPSHGRPMTATASYLNGSSARFAIPEKHSSHHARDLRARVLNALEQGDRHLVVDCEALNKLDLNTLSMLIQCASACREHGASFEIANMSNEVRAEVLALQLGSRLGLLE